MRGQLFQQLDELARERWRRRSLRFGLRGLWVVAAIWCFGLGGHLIMGWPVRADLLGLASLAALAVAALTLMRARMSRTQVARRLDRRFHLDEQLATALELAHERQPGGTLGARVVAESAQTIGLVRRQIVRRQAAPLSDAIMLAALLLMLGGMGLFWAISPRADAAALAPLPNLITPDQQQQIEESAPQAQQGGPQAGDSGGSGEGSEAGSQQSQADPAVLGPIADALRGQGVTRPAAEALDKGDVGGAAENLRELADQAGQISAQTRRNLASALGQAADQISDRSPDLASQVRDSADNIARGGTSAAQGLEDLASALEQAQQAPQQQAGQDGQDQQASQGDQGGQGEQQSDGAPSPGGTGNAPAGEQRETDMPNLASNGKPVELDAQGENANGAGSSDQQPTTAEVVPSQAQGGQGNQKGQQGAIGADPLRVPAEERDVVQDYFTP